MIWSNQTDCMQKDPMLNTVHSLAKAEVIHY